MKLVVFCLFAVCCSSLANPVPNRRLRRKLEEVLRELRVVREQQHNELMLHPPPQDIKDCCCLPALKCFQTNMQTHFNISEKHQGKLYTSLNHTYTVKGLTLFNSGDAECTCGPCESHPQTDATVFFNRLETFIQKGITRLRTI